MRKIVPCKEPASMKGKPKSEVGTWGCWLVTHCRSPWLRWDHLYHLASSCSIENC